MKRKHIISLFALLLCFLPGTVIHAEENASLSFIAIISYDGLLEGSVEAYADDAHVSEIAGSFFDQVDAYVNAPGEHHSVEIVFVGDCRGMHGAEIIQGDVSGRVTADFRRLITTYFANVLK
ncbi:MAG: hypothetical protein HGA67_02745 [Candidatus Yonathbacteria bacterium]|nr:hypothetical protein [Candidatus Yonathbacteria bacterium]